MHLEQLWSGGVVCRVVFCRLGYGIAGAVWKIHDQLLQFGWLTDLTGLTDWTGEVSLGLARVPSLLLW